MTDMEAKRTNVALYYPWLYLTSGAERTILRLVEHSRHDWTIITNRYEKDRTYPGFANLKVIQLGEVSVNRTIWQTARSSFRLLFQKLPTENQEALVVVCEGLGDLVLFRNQLPAMCICLTPLRIAFDEEYQSRWGGQAGPVKKLLVGMGTAVFRMVDRLAWRRYAKIFCISSEVRRRVVKGKLAEEEDIEILLPALGVQSNSEREPFYGDYFLIPGRIMWTKNIELGIEAFRIFQQKRQGFRLVVAGMVDRKSEAYLQRLREIAPEGVEFRIAPSDEELGELYQNCRATLFTAFNEDYGIVPLEGMSHGKTCIAVNRGGPRDTIQHGETGFLEEPEAEAFAARMFALADSVELSQRMGRTAIVHSRKFNWHDFTSRVDLAIDKLVQDSKPSIASRPTKIQNKFEGESLRS